MGVVRMLVDPRVQISGRVVNITEVLSRFPGGADGALELADLVDMSSEQHYGSQAVVGRPHGPLPQLFKLPKRH